ncbi:39S ribosomal protein L36, mitochondrial [Frankliniella occidentalis]|uniref:Large ribosomal subunit protein bL36m n=1 Tax=Frankliniella occidentalis TaxID=133901 RepID=A0A6J1SGY1_FRAOC|nr:39S ribosomal protein L36, mitochondrial [Frankliniella occidentalis]
MSCISTVCRSFSKSLTGILWKSSVCSYSVWNPVKPSNFQTFGILPTLSPSFLKPASVLAIPNAGMKTKGKLRRRCKHCHFVMIEERLHVWCDVHPRHKQMQMIKRPKNVIRLTAVSTGKIRPW